MGTPLERHTLKNPTTSGRRTILILQECVSRTLRFGRRYFVFCESLVSRRLFQPAFESRHFLVQLFWQPVAKLREVLSDQRDFLDPTLDVNAQQVLQIGRGDVEALDVEIRRVG